MSCRCHTHHTRPRVSLDVTRPGWRTATVTIVCGGRSATVRPAALVARHEPEIFAKVAIVLLPKDYVRLKLTGDSLRRKTTITPET